MSVELLRELSVGGYVVGGIFFVISAILFFLLRIPAVIGDLSGATARKAIEDIRRQNEGNHRARKGSAPKKQLVGEALLSRGAQYAVSGGKDVGATEKLATSKLVENMYSGMDSGETTLLSSTSAETTLLTQPSGAETTLLTQPSAGETELLSPDAVSEREAPVAFSVDMDFGFSESAETID